MHPRFFRMFVLVLTLGLSLPLAWGVGALVRVPLFAAQPDSALFLVWSLCLPVIYTVMRFYGLRIGLPVAVLLGLGAAALWTRRLGDVEPVFITLPVGLALVAVAFEVFWGTPRISLLRNLRFGMIAALVNSLAGLVGDVLVQSDITGPGLLHDFRVGLLAALSVCVALSLSECVYIPLAWRWGIPGIFVEEDETPAEDEPSIETDDEETP